MDEATLPERLRDIACDAESPLAGQSRAALMSAADELERLSRRPPTSEEAGERSDVIPEEAVDAFKDAWNPAPLLVSDERIARSLAAALPFLRAAHPEAGNEEAERLREALRQIAKEANEGGVFHKGICADSAHRCAYVVQMAHAALRAVHSEADRAPGEVETVARRFVAYYRAGWAVPAPGSFVQAGPVGSVWRVLAARGVEPKPFEAVLTDPDGGERPAVLFELEPVDPHDVPMTARVDIVPMPLDVAPEPADAGTVQP
jgi:hypothetical protein